ncbi:ArgE/DapE family deacylase [Schleiferilactobacillus perolens]|uniref:Probable succinyl-diaminopimelate desuccinylase n=1 Tax=Schleiferilactobacillus perolens DSM 12744 TaxID=1423792 RepID=A0A0R1NBR6_9LACO|nr:ArgE/DapE family deacylase [Schleiferilactobacillus perolens]KRL13800.1 acetylornithine deacetylase succinyl-diaminopimelate desuccinylase [Schleiferilactobacillus perolens DSM 12744]
MSVLSEDQRIQILHDLVAILSVNDHEQKVAEYLRKLLAAHQIDSQILPVTGDRANLVAEIGSGHPILGISGHMDVVDPGDADQWASDPFTLTERQGNLYGRGATDMKSGLAAMVIAMIELAAQGKPTKGTIRLMATMGEEVGELGSKYFLDDGYMKDVDALLIGEPSGWYVAHAHKGSMDIRFTSHGRAAHSSMPEDGFNAIDPLLQLLQDGNHLFREMNHETNELLGPLTFNTTIFNGGSQVNSIPDKAVAEVNIRTIPELNNAEVKEELQRLVTIQKEDGAQIDMDVYMSQPSRSVQGDSALADLAAKLGQQYSGKELKRGGIAPVTDASNLLEGKPKNYPFVIFGPGNNTPHQVNESVPKKMYLQFCDLYQDLFDQFLNA